MKLVNKSLRATSMSPVYSVVWSLVCLTIILAGCSNPPSQQEQQQSQGPTLESGYNAYINGEYDLAQTDASQFIRDNPESPYLAEAYYLSAISEEAQGLISNATDDFQQAIAITTRPDLKAKSYKSLGDISYSISDYSTAITEYQNALAASPSQPDQWLLLRLGSSLQNEGQWDAAKQYFQQVITDYPGTQTAINATERLSQNHFTLQFGAFQTAATADSAAAALHRQGIAAIVTIDNKSGKLLYLVHSGRYNTHSEAMAARESLAARYPQIIVVP